MCSRRRLGIEQEMQVRRDESEGANRVEGPFQEAAKESMRDGAAVASSWKPRLDRTGGRRTIWENSMCSWRS